MAPAPPVVLCLSGHDPTGGAGLQADIETLIRLGCYPCTVVTALTAQDTHNVRRLWPQRAEAVLEQARLVLADLPVVAIKIGLLGSAELAEAVAVLLDEAGGVPVVLDPILAAGGGRRLADGDLVAALKNRLLPKTTVATPNTPEARQLVGHADLDGCAQALLALGCANVLITGAHEDGAEVVNRWYHAAGMKPYRWPRLPGSYHGSGCTLASAVAGYLAQGHALEDALTGAQQFTWQALSRGFRLGGGQFLPNRHPGGTA